MYLVGAMGDSGTNKPPPQPLGGRSIYGGGKDQTRTKIAGILAVPPLLL